MQIYFGIVAFIFGLVFGSFLNCTAMRIARKQDFVKGKSHCIHCGHDLSAIDLIPVISYLITGGKCRYCREKISKRYPITEVCFGILTIIMYINTVAPAIATFLNSYETEGLLIATIIFFRNMFLTGALYVSSLVDLEIMEIPDGCIITGAIAWIVTAPFIYGKAMLHHILAAVIMIAAILLITILMEKFLKKDALGGGDIKLLTLLALYLGYAGSYELILFSSIFGLIFAAARKIIIPDASREFPFGPAIAFSGYLLLIYSEKITDWYLGLIL